MRNEAGFTLIEVLIALAITAILSMMGVATVNSVMRTKDGLETTVETVQNLELARALIRSDVSQLINRPARDEYASPFNFVFSGNDKTSEHLLMAFIAAGRPSVGRNVHLPSLHFVEYIFRDDKLIRRTRPYIDAAPGHQRSERVLLSDLERVDIQFWDNKTWIEYWDLQVAMREQQNFPAAVWITLHHKSYGAIDNRFFTNIQN